MISSIKVFKREAIILLSLTFFVRCTTPEKRAKENKGTPALHTVVIQQMKFSPTDLSLNEGDTVTWINKDIVDHNVTEERNKKWSSANIQPGKSWNMVVLKSATYLCTIHPVMKGSLNVK